MDALPSIPKALQNKVIVTFAKYRRYGKIILPARYEPQPIQGTVISVGPRANPDIKPGMKVIVSKMKGEYFTLDDTRYCTVPDNAIYLFQTVCQN